MRSHRTILLNLALLAAEIAAQSSGQLTGRAKTVTAVLAAAAVAALTRYAALHNPDGTPAGQPWANPEGR